MGLDAFVYCDCLEQRQREGGFPPNAALVLENDGCPNVLVNGKEVWQETPEYDRFRCIHPYHHLLHERLGNMSLVGLIRNELSREPELFPIILNKVVYSGSHVGDSLTLADIEQMQPELEELGRFRCTGNEPKALFKRMLPRWIRVGLYHCISAKESDEFIGNFRNQLIELSRVAKLMGKPIAF